LNKRSGGVQNHKGNSSCPKTNQRLQPVIASMFLDKQKAAEEIRGWVKIN
jgi:hypothetical protein